jgi:dUTP pyrophosphatase
MVEVKIKKLHKDAVVPNYAHDTDAGLDFYSIEDVVLKPNHRIGVKTGISMELPKGHVALVWDKSGVALKKGVKTMAGVIDAGYRGEYVIVMLNLSSKDFHIKKGDKIAQVLIQKVEQPKLKLVDDLSESSRGKGGFGSTGRK